MINNNVLPSVIYILKLGGLYEDLDSNNKWQKYILKFSVPCIIYVIVGMAIHLMENINNAVILFNGLVYEIGFAVYLLLALNFLWKRDKYVKLLVRLQEIIDLGTSKNFKNNEHLKVEAICKLITKFMVIICVIGVVVLVSAPLIKIFYKYLMGTLTLNDWSYPVEMSFRNIDKNRWIFWLNYLIFTFVCRSMVLFACGLHILYFGVSYHLSVGYKNLQLMLLETDEIPPITSEDNLTNIQNNNIEFKRSMKNCNKFHADLLEFQNDFQKINSESIFSTMILIYSLICLSLLQLTKWKLITYDNIILNVLMYLFGYILLFIYTYTSDMITNEGLKVATAAYNCRWYERTPQQRKYYLLIILVAQRPRYMRGLHYFPCTMETFLKVTKASFSILTIMQALENMN